MKLCFFVNYYTSKGGDAVTYVTLCSSLLSGHRNYRKIMSLFYADVFHASSIRRVDGSER